MRILTITLAAVLTLLAGTELRAEDWPRYRGPNSDGISTETAFAELDSVGLEVSWRQQIGSGYSGIAIADGRVVTAFSDGTSDLIAAFDESTGTELWRHPLEPTYRGHDGSHDGPIATPLIHDGRVFGLSALGLLVALDLEAGTPLWSIDLVAGYGATKPHYGFATSPLVQDGVLIVEVGGEDIAVVGLEPATGEQKWAAGTDAVNYQSPVPWTLDGRPLVLAAGLTKLFGIDAASGEILVTYEHGGEGFRGARSITPVPAGEDRVFLGHTDNQSSVVRLGREGEAIAAERLWEDRSIRNTYTVPVYEAGHLYGYSSRFLACVDAATGETVWRSRQPGDGFVTLVDGRLVILTKRGALHVARATSEGYQELAGLTLFDDLAWTAPSFANGHVFVRSLDELVRVGISEGVTAADADRGLGTGAAGSRFARLLDEVAAAQEKGTVIDRFMSSVESFPLVEPDGQVHFIYRGEGEDLAVAGDMIGSRQERPMTRVPRTDLFYYSTTLEPDARVSYVFIRDFEEMTDSLNPRQTVTGVVGPEMEPVMSGSSVMDVSWLAMPEWKPASAPEPEEWELRGSLETRRLKSEHMDVEHELEVYLPEDYGDGDRRYPVLIVHGGAAAVERGRMAETMDRLAGSRVAPAILVFVKAPSPMGVHGPYSAMVAEEVVPFVDATYRTIPSREGRAHFGAGFSGFAALYTAFSRPDAAAGVGTESATMLDFMRSQLEPLFPSATEAPFDIHMTWGKYDLRNPDEAWDMIETNRHLVGLLREHGYEPTGGETHEGPGWSVWQYHVADMLVALLPVEEPAE